MAQITKNQLRQMRKNLMGKRGMVAAAAAVLCGGGVAAKKLHGSILKGCQGCINGATCGYCWKTEKQRVAARRQACITACKEASTNAGEGTKLQCCETPKPLWRSSPKALCLKVNERVVDSDQDDECARSFESGVTYFIVELKANEANSRSGPPKRDGGLRGFINWVTCGFCARNRAQKDYYIREEKIDAEKCKTACRGDDGKGLVAEHIICCLEKSSWTWGSKHRCLENGMGKKGPHSNTNCIKGTNNKPITMGFVVKPDQPTNQEFVPTNLGHPGYTVANGQPHGVDSTQLELNAVEQGLEEIN